MRILAISNLYPPHAIGGYEMRCEACVEALRSRGHIVEVLTSDYCGPKQASTDDVSIHRVLKLHGFFGRPWLPIYKLYFLERENHRLLQAALDRFQPDVVHVWNMGGLSKSLLFRLQSSRVPLVYDVSDHWIARSLAADVWLKWWNADGSFMVRALRKLLKASGFQKWLSREVPMQPVKAIQFKNIYFCSEYLKNLTASRGYFVSHADVIPCGVPLHKFKRKLQYGPLRRLLWVGRISEDKDPLTTLRGVEKWVTQGQSNIALSFFGKGEGSYFDHFLEALKHSFLGQQVSIGHASQAQMAEVYANYDALIFSSNWGEPFALTPLEAMAAGLPVLMTPDGGGAELLGQGPIALRLQPKDPDYLASALDQFSKLPDHGESMARQARVALEGFYEESAIFSRIEDKLAEAMCDQLTSAAATTP